MKSRMLKTIIAIVMALTVVMFCMPMAMADGADANGKCGENVAWEFDWDENYEVCVLRISGTGSMKDFVPGNEQDLDETYEYAEWLDYDAYSQVSKIVIEGSVERIGTACFSNGWGYDALKEVVIEEGVKEIGNSAFEHNTGKKVTLPKSIEKIGNSAFFTQKAEGATFGVEEIVYAGTAEEWNAIDFAENAIVITESRVLKVKCSDAEFELTSQNYIDNNYSAPESSSMTLIIIIAAVAVVVIAAIALIIVKKKKK